MENFEIKTVWEIRRSQTTTVHEHTHTFYELVYYCYGTGKTWVGDREYDIVPDTFLLVSPGESHGEQISGDSKIYCLGFTAKGGFPGEYFCDPKQAVCQRVREILLESVEQPLQYQKMMRLKLQEIFVEMERLQNVGTRKISSRDFAYLIGYLEENYAEKISLRSLATQFFLSYDYFQHRFKELTGASPQNFLIQKRLEAAARLLEEQPFNCTEIAQRCGFSNSAQFSMMFRREYGVSPMQYRAGKNNFGRNGER